MKKIWERIRGGQGSPPAVPPSSEVALAWLGGFLAIAAVGWLTMVSDEPLVLGSFGATSVLVFGFPDSPFSQPRHVIGGHFVSSLTGLVFLTAFGPHWWAMALALATAMAAMMLTRTVHPPAGSNPIIIMLSVPHWKFLLMPTLCGALVVEVVAVLFYSLIRRKAYPKYWL